MTEHTSPARLAPAARLWMVRLTIDTSYNHNTAGAYLDPLSIEAEHAFLPVLGPTSLLLWRRLVYATMRRPLQVDAALTVAPLASSLGVSERVLRLSLARLDQYRLCCFYSDSCDGETLELDVHARARALPLRLKHIEAGVPIALDEVMSEWRSKVNRAVA